LPLSTRIEEGTARADLRNRGYSTLKSYRPEPESGEEPTRAWKRFASGIAFHALEEAILGFYTRRRLLAVAAVSVLGFCLVVNSSWTATPDSALYLALGESLARGEGYVFNGELHSFVPPGYPLILAAAARLFGPVFLTYRILMALMGLFTAGAAYLFLRRMCGQDTALLAGGLFAVNHVLLHYSTLTLADVPFALFTLIALNVVLSASGQKRRVAWVAVAGFLTGILPLIRINGLGVAPAAAICFLFSWKEMKWLPRIGLVGLFLLLAFAPAAIWQWWKASFPVSFGEGSYLKMVAGRSLVYQLTLSLYALWGYVAETSYAVTGVVLRTGFLELIVTLLILLGMAVAWRRGDRLMVPLTGIQYAGLLLSPAGSRYLILLIPGLYLFLALGILKIVTVLSARTRRIPEPGKVLAACFVFLALLNVGHNFKTVFQSRTALEAGGAQSERSLPFFEASRWLRGHAPESAVLTTHPRIIHYLSGCPTVRLSRSGVPDQEAYLEDPGLIRKLIADHRPRFLFADTKNERLYRAAVAGVKRSGLALEEVPQVTVSPRYRFFRIIRSSDPG